MCINLFYPLIDENLLYLIPKYLNISELNIQDQAFEKESPIEMVTGNQRKTESKTLFALYGLPTIVCWFIISVKRMISGLLYQRDNPE